MKKKSSIPFVSVFVLLIFPTVKISHADLVAYYKLDETSGIIASDSSGHNNHGTLKGGEGVDGINSLYLDAKDNYVEIPHNSIFDITENITVSTWIKVNKFDKKPQDIVSKGINAWRLFRRSSSDCVRFNCSASTGRNMDRGVSGRKKVNDGKWHHIVGTYDGNFIALYVDGALDSTAFGHGPIGSNTDSIILGGNSQRKNVEWNGLIDEVAIFDQALSGSEVSQLYYQGVESFRGSVDKLIEKTKVEIKGLKPKEAIRYIENKITEIDLQANGRLPNMLPRCPDLYYLLAEIKSSSGAPLKEVAAAYKHSVSRLDLRTIYASRALLWFFENMPRDNYANVIQYSMQDIKDPSHIVYLMAKEFESSNNWPAFEIFLETVFSKDGVNKGLCAEFITKGLTQNGEWAGKFSRYCQSKPELTECLFYQEEKVARRHVARKEFQYAVNLYRDIVSRCGPNQDKSTYEYKLCECLFNDGQSENVIKELGGFIQKYKATNSSLVAKAIMLKGRACIQQGEITIALKTFSDLVMNYPDSMLVPEAKFFIGYCYMLQGNSEKAAKELKSLIKEYPQSSHTRRASLCLARIG